MCVNPRVMNNGVSVACRKCWQCAENRINDWVGRCIAESKTAKASHSVTLTYGPDEHGNIDHARAAVLTYSDVQKFLKKLRFDGFPVRYFAVGEFGSEKGRSHWHVVLFWADGVPPDIELRERINQKHWVHGYSYWDDIAPASIRYNCKYIAKDLRKAEQQQQIGMSKKPPLGAAYFADLARRYVKQGLAPQTKLYSFNEARDKKGNKIEFMLKGASLDLFCSTYLAEWEAERGGHPPSSELISDYLDRVSRYLPEITPKPFVVQNSKPWIEPPEGACVMFSKSHNSWYYLLGGRRMFWSFDDRGRRAWQSVIRTETQADALREAFERQKVSDTYRIQSKGR